MVNAPICKGFVQDGPLPLKAGRERQFGKAVGPRLRQERIGGVEQRIGCSLKTVVDGVTKVLQCVKVHPSNAPTIRLGEHYSFGPSSARGMAFLASLVYLSFAQSSARLASP